MKKNKFKIYTLGCKVNQYDSASLSRKLISAGLSLADKEFNIAIINTCAVTKIAVSKSRKMINKAKKESGKGKEVKIIIIGCWPRIYNDEVKRIKPDLILRFIDPKKIAQEILKFVNKDKIKSINFNNKINDFLKIKEGDRSRYFIKIQDGCEQFCSYCIIPYSRGKLRSRSKNEIVEEVKKAVSAGYKEIVLCGIHLGLYGYVEKIKISLVDLLNVLVKIRGLGRIRLSSIEVTEVNNKLIKFILENKKMCKHLHIPLQSGCNKILKLMNRPYNSKYFEDKILKLRKRMKNVAITTDVIVGFPDENVQDFKKTYNFIKKMKFSRLHVFSFSAHEKTPAFSIINKVKNEDIKERSIKLRNLGKNLENSYREKFINKELEIVVESFNNFIIKGKTEFYFDVESRARYKNDNSLIGKIIKVKVLK